jgi:hypothetical protein
LAPERSGARQDTTGTLRFTRPGGSPVLGGWVLVCTGGAVLVLRHYLIGADSTEGLALVLVAGVLSTAGAVVVVRKFRQTITIQAPTMQIVVEDHTRFRSRRRIIRFQEVRELAVEAQTDTDPDARTYQLTTYRLVARLRDGTDVPITDFGLDAEDVAKIREDVARLFE